MPEMPSQASFCTWRLVHAERGQVVPARGLVEQAQDAQAILVVNGRHRIGVAHVVDPGDVLVADALDAVVAEAVHEQRRALQRFGGDDLQRRDSGFFR